jgi:hypothetical protein
MPPVPYDHIVRDGKPAPRMVRTNEELGIQATFVTIDIAVVAESPQRLEGPFPQHRGRILQEVRPLIPLGVFAGPVRDLVPVRVAGPLLRPIVALSVFSILEGLETTPEDVGVSQAQVVAGQAHAMWETDVIRILDRDEIGFQVGEDVIE